MDDQQAIKNLKNGNIEGLEFLVRRYQQKAIRVAFLITQDQPLAEDVVQDSFLRIYQNIARFDLSRPVEPYLMRIVTNAALNAIKKSKRLLSLESAPDQVESLLSQAASVESEVEYIQLKQKIMAALARLEPRRRAALILRYYLEMSEKEMAVALDIPAGTVKWLLSTSRAKIRTLLGTERSLE